MKKIINVDGSVRISEGNFLSELVDGKKECPLSVLTGVIIKQVEF